MTKHILDATCGSRMIWFDKYCEEALYMDNREEDGTAIWKSKNGKSVRHLNVHPDVIADFTNMPFMDGIFDLVVFDPPHLKTVGETAWLKKKYGRLPADWETVIHDGFSECLRVTRDFGTIIFKWNEYEIPVRKVIDAIGYEPLFGNRSGKLGKTHWMVFMKGVSDEIL